MKNRIMFLILAAVLCSFFGDERKISGDDFSPAFGKWEGTLTYLDYTSGKPYSMPAVVTIAATKFQVIFSYEYPNEPKANGTDTLKISEGGSLFDNATVTSKRVVEKGKLELITERAGTDGNEN